MKGKALILVVAVLGLSLATPAQAHKYNRAVDDYEQRMENRIEKYRIDHGEGWLLNAWTTLHLATVALNEDNYRRAKWTTRLEGVPWPQWNDAFLTADQQVANAMMITRRCHGLPYTPRQALGRLMSHAIYRDAMLFPGMAWMGVRVVHIHRHVGAWKGRQRCTAYYIAVAS